MTDLTQILEDAQKELNENSNGDTNKSDDKIATSVSESTNGNINSVSNETTVPDTNITTTQAIVVDGKLTETENVPNTLRWSVVPAIIGEIDKLLGGKLLESLPEEYQILKQEIEEHGNKDKNKAEKELSDIIQFYNTKIETEKKALETISNPTIKKLVMNEIFAFEQAIKNEKQSHEEAFEGISTKQVTNFLYTKYLNEKIQFNNFEHKNTSRRKSTTTTTESKTLHVFHTYEDGTKVEILSGKPCPNGLFHLANKRTWQSYKNDNGFYIARIANYYVLWIGKVSLKPFAIINSDRSCTAGSITKLFAMAIKNAVDSENVPNIGQQNHLLKSNWINPVSYTETQQKAMDIRNKDQLEKSALIKLTVKNGVASRKIQNVAALTELIKTAK